MLNKKKYVINWFLPNFLLQLLAPHVQTFDKRLKKIFIQEKTIFIQEKTIFI